MRSAKLSILQDPAYDTKRHLTSGTAFPRLRISASIEHHSNDVHHLSLDECQRCVERALRACRKQMAIVPGDTEQC